MFRACSISTNIWLFFMGTQWNYMSYTWASAWANVAEGWLMIYKVEVRHNTSSLALKHPAWPSTLSFFSACLEMKNCVTKEPHDGRSPDLWVIVWKELLISIATALDLALLKVNLNFIKLLRFCCACYHSITQPSLTNTKGPDTCCWVGEQVGEGLWVHLAALFIIVRW